MRAAHMKRGAALGGLADGVKTYPVLLESLTQTSRKELVKMLTTNEPTHNIEARAASYLASAKKEQEDEEKGHAAGPNVGGSGGH
ncbi:hypothetical protein KC345_g6332 [Hortaea werneckii]|nr:hypothetical protein KC345_g6332 [Hortaea werneckii]